MIQITVHALSMPDGSQHARVRRAYLDDSGKVRHKEFLTDTGAWVPLLPELEIPGECKLDLEVREVQEETWTH